MKQFKRHLISILFLFIATNVAIVARGPAVQPVSGISIDQYDDVPPSKAIPFDFTQKTQSKKLIPLKKNAVKETNMASLEDSKSSMNTTIVILMVCLLPVAVWLGLMKGVKNLETEAPSNIVELNSKKSSNDDDDIDFPKAS